MPGVVASRTRRACGRCGCGSDSACRRRRRWRGSLRGRLRPCTTAMSFGSTALSAAVQIVVRQARFGGEADDLAERVDAGVGAAGGGHAQRFLRDPLPGRFERRPAPSADRAAPASRSTRRRRRPGQLEPAQQALNSAHRTAEARIDNEGNELHGDQFGRCRPTLTVSVLLSRPPPACGPAARRFARRSWRRLCGGCRSRTRTPGRCRSRGPRGCGR